MVNLLTEFMFIVKNFFNYSLATYKSIMHCYSRVIKKLFTHVNNLLSFSFLLSSTSTVDLSSLEGLSLNQMSLSVEYIKVQELTFLSEYFLITALFCLTLFALFSLKLVVDEEHYLIKFQYNNQLIFY